MMKKQGDSNKSHSKKGIPSNRTNHPNLSVIEYLRFAVIAANLKDKGITILNNTEDLQALNIIFNDKEALEPMQDILSINEKMVLGDMAFSKTFQQIRSFTSMFKIRKTFMDKVIDMEENGNSLELALKFVGNIANKRENIIEAVALSVFYRYFKSDLPTPSNNADFANSDEESLGKKRERESQNTAVSEAAKKTSSRLDKINEQLDTATLSNMIALTMTYGDDELKSKAKKKLKEFWENM